MIKIDYKNLDGYASMANISNSEQKLSLQDQKRLFSHLTSKYKMPKRVKQENIELSNNLKVLLDLFSNKSFRKNFKSGTKYRRRQLLNLVVTEPKICSDLRSTKT